MTTRGSQALASVSSAARASKLPEGHSPTPIREELTEYLQRVDHKFGRRFNARIPSLRGLM